MILTLLLVSLVSCVDYTNKQAAMYTTQQTQISLSETYKRDSIRIENKVEFYTYSDDQTPPTNAVRFIVKVTNLGHLPIPNLMRVGNRSNYLRLFYNDKPSYHPNLVNGLEGDDWPWQLKRFESDTFETGYVLFKNARILSFGNPVRVKWQYLGIDSPVVKADLKKRRICAN